MGPTQRNCWRGILIWLHLSDCLSCMLCPLHNTYSSGWIISVLGKNHHIRYISSRSFSHNFAITLLKYHTIICSTACKFWIDSFHIWHKWSLACKGVLCTITFDLDWYFQGYSTMTWRVLCTACAVLDGFFLNLTQMIISMRGCLAHIDFWPWPISSRFFNCDVAYFMDHFHMWHKYNPWGDDVMWDGWYPNLSPISSCTIS